MSSQVGGSDLYGQASSSSRPVRPRARPRLRLTGLYGYVRTVRLLQVWRGLRQVCPRWAAVIRMGGRQCFVWEDGSDLGARRSSVACC